MHFIADLSISDNFLCLHRIKNKVCSVIVSFRVLLTLSLLLSTIIRTSCLCRTHTSFSRCAYSIFDAKPACSLHRQNCLTKSNILSYVCSRLQSKIYKVNYVEDEIKSRGNSKQTKFKVGEIQSRRNLKQTKFKEAKLYKVHIEIDKNDNSRKFLQSNYKQPKMYQLNLKIVEKIISYKIPSRIFFRRKLNQTKISCSRKCFQTKFQVGEMSNSRIVREPMTSVAYGLHLRMHRMQQGPF